jgi:hypothetical protein
LWNAAGVQNVPDTVTQDKRSHTCTGILIPLLWHIKVYRFKFLVLNEDSGVTFAKARQPTMFHSLLHHHPPTHTLSIAALPSS